MCKRFSNGDRVCVVNAFCTRSKDGGFCLTAAAGSSGAVVNCEPTLDFYRHKAFCPGWQTGVVDACSGMGTWMVAHWRTGWNDMASADMAPQVVKTANINLKGSGADVYQADFTQPAQWARLTDRAPFLALLGFSCKAFSKAGDMQGTGAHKG